jgi:Uma2 family endonuclease
MLREQRSVDSRNGPRNPLSRELRSPRRARPVTGGCAKAGGTADHAAVTVNVSTQLATQLRRRPCRVFSSDFRIRSKATGLGTYPDLSVISGKIQFDSADASRTTATNPKVLVEVLSPSAEAYDRGEKLDHYKKIPALEEIVLVAPATRTIEIWRRGKAGWRVTKVDSGVATLTSVDVERSITETFRDPLA